jgi:HSP20 family protein
MPRSRARRRKTFGRVARYFTLGYEVDETQASAKYADGVLELTLPKNGATGAQKLTIQ